MSGNIFGDDDDFELTLGGDDFSSAPKPPAVERKRPVAPSARQTETRRPLPAENSETQAAPVLPQPAPRTRPGTGLPPAPGTQSRLPVRPTPAQKAPVEEVKPQPSVQQNAPQPVGHHEPAPREEHYPTPAPAPRVEAQPRQTSSYEEPADYHAPHDSGFNEAPQSRSNTNVVPTIRDARSYDTSRDEMDELFDSRREQRATFVNAKPEETKQQVPAKESRAKRSGKPVKAKEPKNEGPGKFAGGRRNVLIVRTVAASLVLLFVGIGVNSIVNPPPIPTPEKVNTFIKKELNITKFPTDSGYAFVSAFSKEYLTFSPDKRSQKTDALKMYTTDTLASDLAGGTPEGISQKVTEGPIISGVRSLSDNDAVYTVGAKVDTSWVYMDVPVYFDPDAHSFSVSGTPAFIAPPVKPKTLPAIEAPFSADPEKATIMKPQLENFFEAWATSDPDDIKPYVNVELADVETEAGLQNTVKFVSLTGIKVEKKEQDAVSAEDYKTRRVQVKVTWANPASPKITYDQNYNLTLVESEPDRWLVADIIGGVRVPGT